MTPYVFLTFLVLFAIVANPVQSAPSESLEKSDETGGSCIICVTGKDGNQVCKETDDYSACIAVDGDDDDEDGDTADQDDDIVNEGDEWNDDIDIDQYFDTMLMEMQGVFGDFKRFLNDRKTRK